MRIEDRIPIVLKLIKNNKYSFIKYLLSKTGLENYKELIPEILERLEQNWDKAEELYRKNPDLRITQVLVNTNIFPNFQGFWYYKEDDDLMIESGLCEPRDIYFWGVNYDKNGNRLYKTEFRLIKDLKIKHIKNILKLDYISDKYRKLLEEELKLQLS